MTQPILKIKNAQIPFTFKDTELCDITCYGSDSWDLTLSTRSPTPPNESELAPFRSTSTLSNDNDGVALLDAAGSILLVGGLVHPHLHLDKCFLLDRCEIKDGSFKEALVVTNEAKKQFTEDDLIKRGTRLIRESLSHGVTAMRVHVEVIARGTDLIRRHLTLPQLHQVDPTVKLKCLSAGFTLQSQFRDACSLQIVAFAQDPFFRQANATSTRLLPVFKEAIKLSQTSPSSHKISAIGSAPYVESDLARSIMNIRLVFRLAREAQLDVDFHLDYDLDTSTPALVWEVLRTASQPENRWKVAEGRNRRITLGHCTKLSVFTSEELDRLATEVKALDGDVHFVALPPSDMYMQGRETPYATRSRATFPALELVKRGIPCSVGVNNIENAFTPQGNADPLSLLPLLVGVWQDATPTALESLLAMVTTSASLAAGLTPPTLSSLKPTADLKTKPGSGPATFTLLDGCTSLTSAVLAPCLARTTIFEGKIVARRTVESRVAA